LRGLDWFIFFVADVQTGFGPFVSVYLTAQKWTQVDIGPGSVRGGPRRPGRADSRRSSGRFCPLRNGWWAGLAVAAISVSALAYAAWPILPVVLSAAVAALRRQLCARPAIAAISLGLVGHAAVGERLGRNARFRVHRATDWRPPRMGACGYFLSASRGVLRHGPPARTCAYRAFAPCRRNEIDPSGRMAG